MPDFVMRTGSSKLQQREPLRKMEILYHKESAKIFINLFGDPAGYGEANYFQLGQTHLSPTDLMLSSTANSLGNRPPSRGTQILLRVQADNMWMCFRVILHVCVLVCV